MIQTNFTVSVNFHIKMKSQSFYVWSLGWVMIKLIWMVSLEGPSSKNITLLFTCYKKFGNNIKHFYIKSFCYFAVSWERFIPIPCSRVEYCEILEHLPLLLRFIVSQTEGFRDITGNSSHALCFTCCWRFVDRQISHQINQRHEHTAVSHEGKNEVLNQ